MGYEIAIYMGGVLGIIWIAKHYEFLTKKAKMDKGIEDKPKGVKKDG